MKGRPVQLLKRIACTYALLICALAGHSQKGVTNFGLSFRPIIPLGLVNTQGFSVKDQYSGTDFNLAARPSYSMGAVIRFGLTNRFSLETGIHYVARNYNFKLDDSDYPYSSASLRFSCYEIPLHGMVFVRLGEQTYMTATAGLVFDLFPTGGLVTHDRDTIEYGMLENHWIHLSLGSNLGFEWRTEKNGWFYFGASYHNTLGDMAKIFISYRKPYTNTFVRLISPDPSVNGNYLSLDLRYFFNPGTKVNKREN